MQYALYAIIIGVFVSAIVKAEASQRSTMIMGVGFVIAGLAVLYIASQISFGGTAAPSPATGETWFTYVPSRNGGHTKANYVRLPNFISYWALFAAGIASCVNGAHLMAGARADT
jgi:hypothetical protein